MLYISANAVKVTVKMKLNNIINTNILDAMSAVTTEAEIRER